MNDTTARTLERLGFLVDDAPQTRTPWNFRSFAIALGGGLAVAVAVAWIVG